MASLLVAAENNLPDLFFAGGLVHKTKLNRPDAVELYPTRSCLDKLLGGVPEDGLFPEVGILKENHIVGLNTSLRNREVDFIGLGENA